MKHERERSRIVLNTGEERHEQTSIETSSWRFEKDGRLLDEERRYDEVLFAGRHGR